MSIRTLLRGHSRIIPMLSILQPTICPYSTPNCRPSTPCSSTLLARSIPVICSRIWIPCSIPQHQVCINEGVSISAWIWTLWNGNELYLGGSPDCSHHNYSYCCLEPCCKSNSTIWFCPFLWGVINGLWSSWRSTQKLHKDEQCSTLLTGMESQPWCGEKKQYSEL